MSWRRDIMTNLHQGWSDAGKDHPMFEEDSNLKSVGPDWWGRDVADFYRSILNMLTFGGKKTLVLFKLFFFFFGGL